jgi:CRISPR/Cas system-associated exonuclease Cas4 (RecB family)
MSYVLGEREGSNRKADLGSVVHKILEILAHRKNFKDETGSYKYPFDVDKVTEKVWKHFQPKRDDWEPGDLNLVKEWVQKALTMDQGAYDPRTLSVLESERQFDLTLDYDWASYEYNSPTGPLKGQLAIKGTIDLVLKGENFVELLDWKTGRRLNWATGKVKSYDDLKKDNQLLLYYYVARKLYNCPVVVTIVFINDGGAYTLGFDDSDMEKAERMLQEKFEQIRDTRPTPIWPNRFCNFCSFSKTYYDKPIIKNGKPLNKCLHIQEELVQLGQYHVVANRIQNDGKHLTAYGSGGGRNQE